MQQILLLIPGKIVTYLKIKNLVEQVIQSSLHRFLPCHIQAQKYSVCLCRIFTLYSKSLPLDVACRVWDVFCRDGEESLFRTGLGVLRLYEDVLLQMDFIHIAQFLTRLPEDLQSHTLFNAMASTQMISRNRRWAQVSLTVRGQGSGRGQQLACR